MAKNNETDKLTKTACYLYSRANYPVSITYKGEDIILPPNAAKVKIADESKLGALPKLVRKVTIQEDK